MPCSAGRATYTEKGERERERERSEKVERDRERERETERGRASRSGAIINDIIRAEEKERGGTVVLHVVVMWPAAAARP